jgi:hypothetical protein
VTALELEPFEHDALMIDRALWPNVDHLPIYCEARSCTALADPRAVAVTSYACLEHMPADVLEEVTR